MMKKTNKIIIYKNKNKKIEVSLKEETIWLSLNQIAQLFDKDKSVVSRHIRNIFNTGELRKTSTVAKFATIQIEGNRVKFFDNIPEKQNKIQKNFTYREDDFWNIEK